MASVTQIRIENVTPIQLVEQARAGRVRVPSFQRSYRWQPRDVERLFDSVLKRYPVGNLLLWDRPAEAGRVVLGPLDIEVPARARARWVVDGQQRITSLVGALAAPPEVTDPRFAVYVHLTSRRFRATATPPGAGWLPLRVAGSTQDLLVWQREHWGELSDDQLAVADDVAGSLREYPIPAYVVEADSERDLREVFDRMNGAGRPLRRREVFDALHGMQDVTAPGDLGGVADTVAASGFGRLGDDDVLRCLLALRGPDVFRDVHDEFADDPERRAAFQITERTLLDVVAVLRGSLSVPHAQLLPYPSVLPMLATFLHRFGAPQGRAETLIRRWFWRGAALGNPAGSPPRVRRTLRGLARADSAVDAAQVMLAELPHPGETWAGPDLSQTAMNRSQARINVLGLLHLEPRELLPHDSDDPDAPAPSLAVPDLIDAPTQPLIPLLPDRGAGTWAGSLANRLLHPPRYEGTTTVAALLATDAATRLSHGVDATTTELLAAGDVEAALGHRADLLLNEIAVFVDAGAEWGALDRPTIAELVQVSVC